MCKLIKSLSQHSFDFVTQKVHREILSLNGITWLAPCPMNKKIWGSHLCKKTPTVVNFKEEITSFSILERLLLQFTFEFLLRTQVALVHLLYLEAWTPINTWES